MERVFGASWPDTLHVYYIAENRMSWGVAPNKSYTYASRAEEVAQQALVGVEEVVDNFSDDVAGRPKEEG